MNTIKTRWANARKIEGAENVVILADGGQIAGRYILTECGSCTPSHNALQGFAPSDGFPTDENGGSVNDRDYQRDQDAQRITREIASGYDGRALQNPVIVSPDGVVMSGNGRTMAGELAAQAGTDGAYINHLRGCCALFGFTPEQVTAFAHPRLLFVTRDAMPYTAATFARFNQAEQKSQSKTEQAVKYGKLIDNATFGRILAIINAFETLGDFYACTEAATKCINELRGVGIVDAMSYAAMFDGDTISGQGRETLENVLIGRAFASFPDCARMVTEYRSLRKSVVFALSELVNCLSLSDAYALTNELTEAVKLAYVARSHGYKAGERVSDYARQIDAFTAETVSDFKNPVILILADAINDDRATALKRIIAVYNHQANDASNGQTDIFCTSGVKTKAEILNDVKTIFAKGSTKEQKQAIQSANKARTADNLFIMDDCLKQVKKGSYVEYKTLSGEVIICHVDEIKRTIAYLSGKGGIKLWCSLSELKATADHRMTLPTWLEAGRIITDGSVSQRIASVTDNFVIFEWINGGYFDINITTVLQKFRPSASDVCELIEAA